MSSIMNIEGGSALPNGTTNNNESSSSTSLQLNHNMMKSLVVKYWILLMSAVLSVIGFIGGPLLLRLYFVYGGKRKWIPALLGTAGFPILLIPISINYLFHRRNSSGSSRKFFISRNLFLTAAVIGLLNGIDNFMYAIGLSFLPVSTSAIVYSTYLIFIAFFALLIIRQSFTPYSVNSVVLMTLGSILLGIRQNGDRPPGVTGGQYLLGFLMTIGAAVLLGLINPCTELAFIKAAKSITYSSVLQFQFCNGLSASLFCIVGMIINKDFAAMPREATEFGLGESKYYLVLVMAAVACQMAFLGSVGMMFCSSALASGIFVAMLLPFATVGGAIAYHEKFSGEKGISLAMCLWGFASYFYGSYRDTKKQNTVSQIST
ncbi:hypothetical protein Syun_002420 [Stephania yunnanensis]|uniref:Probable purine permease n=1 Tax=Stephania yunnanensis TaxID=152371 RepID=A0AAP0LIL1_9MAGN